MSCTSLFKDAICSSFSAICSSFSSKVSSAFVNFSFAEFKRSFLLCNALCRTVATSLFTMAFLSAACFASCFAWFVAPSPSISCFKTAICFVLFFHSFILNTETYIIIENTRERELKKLLHICETAQKRAKRVFSSRFRSQRGHKASPKSQRIFLLLLRESTKAAKSQIARRSSSPNRARVLLKRTRAF